MTWVALIPAGLSVALFFATLRINPGVRRDRRV